MSPALLFPFLSACTQYELKSPSSHDSGSSSEYYEPSEAYPEPSSEYEEDIGEDIEEEGEGEETELEAGTLTAGEWNDIENWDFWLSLIDDPESDYYQFPQNWGFSPNQKVQFTLYDAEKPAIDTALHLFDANGEAVWKSRTNNRGVAQLFPTFFDDNTGPFSLYIETRDGLIEYSESFSLPVNKSLSMEIGALPSEKIIDLMFVVDTTGSMCDELSYLQTELQAVINESQMMFNNQTQLRTSVNFYRDHGDDYVTRSFPFSENIDTVVSQLQEQDCGGGGDFPEAVTEALTDAIDGHSWSPSAQARIMFLVLDAPPHDNAQSLTQIQSAIESAAEKGIQIIPIASSGLDKDTEFFLRSIDIATNGTYVFLTDHSGIGESHLKASVGEFEVRPLNDLMVDLIVEASITE